MNTKSLTVNELVGKMSKMTSKTIPLTPDVKIFVDLDGHLPIFDHSDIPSWDPSDTREELIETIEELSRMLSETVDKIESLSEDPSVADIEFYPEMNTVGIKITNE